MILLITRPNTNYPNELNVLKQMGACPTLLNYPVDQNEACIPIHFISKLSAPNLPGLSFHRIVSREIRV